MHVRKEDQVLVISGDYSGKKSRVLKVFPESKRVIVEGVNLIKRHTKPTQKNPQGGIVEKEASIHASNVIVICPKCNSVTKIGVRVVRDESTGKANRVRVCKQCGEMLVKAA